jgi:hypothetical protein
MQLKPRPSTFAALSAAVLFLATTSLYAQAQPLGNGGGKYINNSNNTNHFTFSAVQLPNGSVKGHAIWHSPDLNAMAQVELTSFMYIGEWLAVAGTITKVINVPPEVELGATAFIVFRADGSPAHTGFSFAPLAFGELTIQQIIAMLGPPQPIHFFPIISGTIKIH